MTDSLDQLHILCYRWGTRYGVEYVNNLCRMVARNLRIPHVFHCVTDSTEGLLPEVEAQELPDAGVSGNWNKLQTFKKDFLGLEGQYLVCMDLDLVIVGDLNFLTVTPEEPFLIARSWAKGIRGNSSVYRVQVGTLTHVWDDFIADPEGGIEQHFGKNRLCGDQNWLNHSIPRYAYFPEGKIVSFKRQCHAKGHWLPGRLGKRLGLTTAAFGKAAPPPGAAIVSFHGDPLPPDVMHGRCGRWRHAPFVAEHWRQ